MLTSVRITHVNSSFFFLFLVKSLGGTKKICFQA